MAFVLKSGDTIITTTLTNEQVKAVNMLLKQGASDDNIDQAYKGLDFGLTMYIIGKPMPTTIGLTKIQKLILKNRGNVNPH